MTDQDPQREKMRQRQEETRQKLSAVLDRAVTDTQFRQVLLDDPRTALGAPKTDAHPQIPAEVMDERRKLLQQVLERAEHDPQFHAQLKQEPRKALMEGGFGAQLEQLRAELPQEEVRAYTASWWGGSWISSGLVNPWGNWAGGGWSGG